MDFLTLKKIAPNSRDWIAKGIVDNWDLLEKHKINTPIRINMFLAQIAHESAGFLTTEEFASGEKYEGRKDLGNTIPGDGKRYKGRGLIQLTGRYNYNKYGKLLDADLEKFPELAGGFPVALETACLFWELNHCNDYADKNAFEAVTKKINGKCNGIENRKRWLKRITSMMNPNE